MGELRRRPERQPVLVGVVDGDRAASLDRVRAAAVLLEIDADAPRGAREGIRGVAIGLLELDQEVALAGPVGARRLRGERVAAIGDRGQRFVIDGNQRRSVFGGRDGRTVYVTEVKNRRLVQFRVDTPGQAWRFLHAK